jgi:hypothetical protein
MPGKRMINPTEEDIGRRVIHHSPYYSKEGTILSIGTDLISVRFDPKIGVFCRRENLEWKYPCPSTSPPNMDSNSPATPAGNIGNPLASESGQNVLNSLTSGTEPRPKDGDASLQEQQIKKGIRNGLIDARAAAFKLPPVNPNRRPEVAAFIEGYCLCFKGIIEMFDPDERVALLRKVGELALELYPNHEPSPEPQKRTEDGRRRDGINMEK